MEIKHRLLTTKHRKYNTTGNFKDLYVNFLSKSTATCIKSYLRFEMDEQRNFPNQLNWLIH